MLVTVKESYVLFLFLEKFSTAHNKRKFVRPRPCVCVGEPSCGESKTASLVHSLGSRQSAHPPPPPRAPSIGLLSYLFHYSALQAI